ncbi:MAG: hypothetical protein LUP94_00360 [Candidatus Methanomethylicus sp.]|nr:hypothetical protein [Candidatus Methanomethylicus sp.]
MNSQLTQQRAEFNANYASLQSSKDVLQSNYIALNTNYTSLQSNYYTLSSNHAILQSNYNTTQTQKNALQSNYDSLGVSYTNLMSDYYFLNGSYVDTLDSYRSLNESASLIMNVLNSYTLVTDSFERTLDDAAIRKTSSETVAAVGGTTNFWPAMQKIYNYVRTNVDYVHDIEMPYPSLWQWQTFENETYFTNINISTTQNYIQSPELTLDILQGDCDDMAILNYAMIKYFMIYVSGSEYDLYLAQISFSGGDAHLAIILPVTGDRITIIDPAGNYLTESYSTIDAQSTLIELQAYSSYWNSHGYGSITSMSIYNITVVDGDYNTIIEDGNLNQVANAINNIT